MTLDRETLVLEREELSPGIFRLTLSAEEDFLREAGPGRFVQVEVSPEPFPLVRRPFTVNRADAGSFRIVFEVKGRGTDKLSRLSEGTRLRVLGPLGRGYRMLPGRWLLIGGGMGAAGFPCLAERIDCGLILLGASSGSRLLEVGGFSNMCITEDGSSGARGLVTDLLDRVRWDDFCNVALCGPVAMMKAVVRRLPDAILEATQVSAEARMGCGWGACEGCSIPASGGGYLKCCSDGPVVPAASIDWDLWEGV